MATPIGLRGRLEEVNGRTTFVDGASALGQAVAGPAIVGSKGHIEREEQENVWERLSRHGAGRRQ